LPAGIPVREVASLAELTRSLETEDAALVLCDAERLEAEAEGLQAWLKAASALPSLLVGVAEPAQAEALLERCPFLDDLWAKPLTPGWLRLRLDRALDAMHGRRVIRQLDQALARKSQELHELNRIGVALSAEHDIDSLLQLILAKSCEIVGADAGSLYLVERASPAAAAPDLLRFKLTRNDSVAVSFEEFTMPLDVSSIAGYAALTGRVLNLVDVYGIPKHAPYAGSGGSARAFDEKSGYRTKSMLVVPMKDHRGIVIGVVQLINKKRDRTAVLRPVSLVEQAVIPFTGADEELLTSLTSQAAVGLEKTRLVDDVRALFDSFVRAAVTAIEQRDPTTSGHSSRVAVLTQALAETVDRQQHGRFREVRFSREQLQELRYASLLHDFGKVGVREQVLVKGRKLYAGELLVIRHRFAYVMRSLEAEHLRAQLALALAGEADPQRLQETESAYEEKRRELQEILRAVRRANEPSLLEEQGFRVLMGLSSRTFVDDEGRPQPLLTQDELSALQIAKGTLSERERREIESHVTHTFHFLSEIPWTDEFRGIPAIAYAHHEKLDGTGYPRRLTAADIPLQSRMMTIADIFDALVAWDRPYKRAVPVEQALDILGEEAEQGKLDADLLRLFVDAKVFEATRPPAGALLGG
jgi:HD-GYP domain-containing protein (c-di-GMP phosphodiesterase class II)